MNSATETLTPVIEPDGFTIVQEDDVAFSLSLCREIHRIYGSYQTGELETGDSVRIGLLLSTQMLSMLGGSVTKGMPAMRLEVAAAQTREMVSVLFGEPTTTKKARGTRPAVQRHCQRSVAASMPTGTTEAVGGKREAPAIGGAHQAARGGGNAASLPEVSAQSLPKGGPAQTAPQGVDVTVLHRWRQSFRKMPKLVQVLLGVIGCGLAAIFVDIPVVILLLFSNLFVPLSVCFVSVGVLGPRAFRRLRARAIRRREVAPA